MTRRAWAWLLPALLVAGCGDSGKVGPEEGEITLVLTTSRPGTGALLIRVTGVVSEVRGATDGLRIASTPVGATGVTRLVVTGPIETGDLLRLRVPDVSQADSYSGTVEQAASSADFALLDPVAFGVAFRR